jgi:hypothetical protein
VGSGSFFRIGFESRAGRVGHVHDTPRHFQVGEVGIAAPGRHLVEALEGMGQQDFIALAVALAPVRRLLELGGSQGAGGMATGTDLVVDLLAGALHLGRVRVDGQGLAEGLDTRPHRLVGQGRRVGLPHAALDAEKQHDDQENRQDPARTGRPAWHR